ncbi:hypothetical protein [Actinomadura sp. DC4]|uniref:hypothetical protein n=1 Tax=Actinomadura sp. DC4 TaxID=3055069 RepID=UPI0025AEF225|nr:hypothetical protein [Actinomadura sp. DC4]MDN3357653.1 hypothetical protein [Actinomadura sp. DC4]
MGEKAIVTVCQFPSGRTELAARVWKAEPSNHCQFTEAPPSVKRNISPSATVNLTSLP